MTRDPDEASPTDATADAAAGAPIRARVWWSLGGGVAALIVIALVVPRFLGTDAPEEPPASAPAATDAAEYELPAEITFAAGASLPPTLQPGFTSALRTDPAWTADRDATDLGAGRLAFTHTASDCTLVTYQTLATDVAFDPADDYSNSIATLMSVYGVDDIGAAPGSYFYKADSGASTIESATVLAQLESGEGELTTARGFGASNVALVTQFTCPDAGTTAALFESLALPAIAVTFVEG